jgi:hypothetical protein
VCDETAVNKFPNLEQLVVVVQSCRSEFALSTEQEQRVRTGTKSGSVSSSSTGTTCHNVACCPRRPSPIESLYSFRLFTSFVSYTLLSILPMNLYPTIRRASAPLALRHTSQSVHPPPNRTGERTPSCMGRMATCPIADRRIDLHYPPLVRPACIAANRRGRSRGTAGAVNCLADPELVC